MVRPDFSVVVKRLVSLIPDKPGAIGLVAAIAGTTCYAILFIMRTAVVLEIGGL